MSTLFPAEPPKTQKDVQLFQKLLKRVKSVEEQKHIFEVLLPISCPHHFFEVEGQWYFWFAPTAEVQDQGLCPSIDTIYGHDCQEYQANIEGRTRLDALMDAFSGVLKEIRNDEE